MRISILQGFISLPFSTMLSGYSASLCSVAILVSLWHPTFQFSHASSRSGSDVLPQEVSVSSREQSEGDENVQRIISTCASMGLGGMCPEVLRQSHLFTQQSARHAFVNTGPLLLLTNNDTNLRFAEPVDAQPETAESHAFVAGTLAGAGLVVSISFLVRQLWLQSFVVESDIRFIEKPSTQSELESEPYHTAGELTDKLGMTMHHYYVFAVVCTIFACSGWTCTVVPFAMDAASEPTGDWTTRHGETERLTLFDLSLVNVCAGLTAMVTNIAFGYLSDIKGRILALTLGLGLASLATSFMAFAWCKWLIMALIISTPFGRDSMTSVSNCLLAEWSPTCYRDRLLVVPHGIWNVGRFAMTFMWFLVPPEQSWMLFMCLAAIFPVALCGYLTVRGYIYESPRFLATRGLRVECVESLSRAVSTAEERKRLPVGWDDPDRLCIEDTEGNSTIPESQSYSDYLKDLLSPEVYRVLVPLSVNYMCLQYASTASFLWMIPYLKAIGAGDAILPAMIAAPCGKVASFILLVVGGSAYSIIDTWPKVPLIKLGFIFAAVFVSTWATTIQSFDITTYVFYYNIFEELLWIVMQNYMTEQFPTDVRSTACGVVFTLGTLGSISAGASVGYLMKLYTPLPILVMSLSLSMGFVVCFSLPQDHLHEHLADRVGSKTKA